MSRLNELKKQYPELNITMLDVLSRLDKSGTYKYLPLICKIFGKRWSFDAQVYKNERDQFREDMKIHLDNKGIISDDLTDSSLYVHYRFADEFVHEHFETMNQFIKLMELNQVENNDVTSYKNIDEVRSAVTLASMKVWEKELENQSHKEYEDKKWLIVRPLTFSSSCKYGASTRWCTTYKNEKQYFEKYWRRGILIYFINKETGYKVAGFKALDGDTEFSFWNAEDQRVDFLEISFDDYLYSIIRSIFKSQKTNHDLCSYEIREQVFIECGRQELKMRAEISEINVEVPLDELIGMEPPVEEYSLRRNEATVRSMTEAPVYAERPSIA